MNMIRPVSDLRNNFAEISKTVNEPAQTMFLTKNGYGELQDAGCRAGSRTVQRTLFLQGCSEGDEGRHWRIEGCITLSICRLLCRTW